MPEKKPALNQDAARAALMLLAAAPDNFSLLEHPGGAGIPPFAIMIARSPGAIVDMRALFNAAISGKPTSG